MLTIVVILILIACILLIGVVLIQNPKGGGLSSTFGGMSNQIMGVQRTTDFLEKSTWTLMIAVAILSLCSVFFFTSTTTTTATPDQPKSQFENTTVTTPQQAPPMQQQPAQQQPAQQTPPATDPAAQPQQQPNP